MRPALRGVGVSHNVSRAKQDELERSSRLAGLQPYLVPGWRIDRESWRIVPVETVLGHFQRGQEMLLRCRRADCQRRLKVDFEAAVRAGLGERSIADLVAILKCGHWNGCRLEEVSAQYPRGVPLVSYLGHGDVLISIRCRACENNLLLRPAEVITRLKAAGRGDGSTGVIELATAIRGPCRKCGTSLFETNVLWAKDG